MNYEMWHTVECYAAMKKEGSALHVTTCSALQISFRGKATCGRVYMGKMLLCVCLSVCERVCLNVRRLRIHCICREIHRSLERDAEADTYLCASGRELCSWRWA